MTRIIVALLALALCGASAARAQDASVLGAGTRVRLTTPSIDPSQQIGTVVASTRDSITFRSDSYPVTRIYPVRDLTSIEISAGKQTHRGRDALYGLAIGGSAGALLGAATYKKPTQCYWFCDTRSSDAIAGGVLGGLVGTLMGAYVFGSFDKTERWVPLRKLASVQIVPAHGGASLALSARF